MAQNKTYSGGHTKQRRGWVNTSSGSSRPVGRGSGSSNFRNHSNRQYQQYTAYHQTDYQDSYYDYASGYVGDYRNAPQYQQRAIQQSYIDSEPDYQEHAASKMQSNRNQSSPSVGSLRLHSLHPAPTLSSISGSQHTTETDEIAHDYSAKEHESLKPPMPTLAKSNFKKEEYRNQGNYQTKKSQPNFNPRTAPSQQYYQAQPTTHLPISPTLEYYGHHIIPTQHPVVPQQPYYAPSNEYPMGYVTAAWPQHQFPSPNYSTYQYPQQVQYGESQGYSPQQGHSPHPGGDHRSSGYGKPFPHY